MKALRWHGKKDLRVDEIPAPEPKDDEVLIKVTYSGICGSEVHEYVAGPVFIPLEPHPLTGSCAPQIMGHEYGGVIEKVGSVVKGLSLGDMVTVNPILACGQCPACKKGRPNLCVTLAYYGLIGDGGHAEYSVVKAANCVKIPNGSTAEFVAFGEPAGVAYHAVNQAMVNEGDTVSVIGGGPIGQLVAQYAKIAGAKMVIMSEIATKRIDIARQIGAVDHLINPIDEDPLNRTLELTNGQGVDVAIECSGGSKTGLLEDTASLAVEMTRAEGTAVIVGTFAEPTNFHFNNIVLMERRVIGSWVWHSPEEYSRAMKLIVTSDIQVLPLISSKVSLQRAVRDGILPLLANKDDQMKILINLT